MASARQAAAATSSSAATSQEAEKAQEAPSAPSVAPLADVNAPPPPAAPLAAAPAAAPPPAPSAPPAAAAPPSAPSTAGGEGADEGSTTAANYSTSLAPVAADLSTALDASATHESSSSSSRCDAESEVDGVADDLRSKLRLNHEAAPTTAGGGSAAATATAESAQGAGGTGAAPKKVKVSRRASVVVSGLYRGDNMWRLKGGRLGGGLGLCVRLPSNRLKSCVFFSIHVGVSSCSPRSFTLRGVFLYLPRAVHIR